MRFAWSPSYSRRVTRFGADGPGSGLAAPEFAPVPGMALLALYGLGLWIVDPSYRPWVKGAFIAIQLCVAASLMIGRATDPGAGAGNRPGPGSVTMPHASCFYACVVVAAIAYSVIRLPVAQEFFPGTTYQARMVASPPDNAIPYWTAAYMEAGYGGKERSDEYSGPGWSIASRGPLVPLMVLGSFDWLCIRPARHPSAWAVPGPRRRMDSLPLA